MPLCSPYACFKSRLAASCAVVLVAVRGATSAQWYLPLRFETSSKHLWMLAKLCLNMANPGYWDMPNDIFFGCVFSPHALSVGSFVLEFAQLRLMQAQMILSIYAQTTLCTNYAHTTHILRTYYAHTTHILRTNKQTNKQRNKQTKKQTDRQTDRQTDKPRHAHTKKQKNKETKKQTNKPASQRANQPTNQPTNKQTPWCDVTWP